MRSASLALPRRRLRLARLALEVLTCVGLAVPVLAAESVDRWTNPVFVADRLSKVPPLDKPHLTWPRFNKEIWRRNEPAVRQQIRITRAVGFNLNYIDANIKFFGMLNALMAEYDAVPYVLLEPYNYPHAEVARPANLDFSAQGFQRQLAYVDHAVALAAERMSRPPAYALLDTEVFRGGISGFQDFIVWLKLSLVYVRIKMAWPHCQVIWFCQGATRPVPRAGWRTARTVPLSTLTDGYSVALYSPEDQELMREMYRRTCAVAAAHGVERVLPWFSFGYQTRLRVVENGKRVERTRDRNVAWDPNVAWELGREFDAGVEPWTRADVSCGWPGPYVGARLRPGYWQCFEAFARGAAAPPSDEARSN